MSLLIAKSADWSSMISICEVGASIPLSESFCWMRFFAVRSSLVSVDVDGSVLVCEF